MLHACFVYIPTCFMCTLIQYLAFSRTNLLTRCHSASSCFLLFLYFRKVTYEIFSELDQTKAKVPNIPKDSGSQKETRGRLPGGQTPPRRGPTLARAWVASGPTRAPPTPPLRPYIPRFGKPLGTREKIHEKFRSRRYRRSKIRGT